MRSRRSSDRQQPTPAQAFQFGMGSSSPYGRCNIRLCKGSLSCAKCLPPAPDGFSAHSPPQHNCKRGLCADGANQLRCDQQSRPTTDTDRPTPWPRNWGIGPRSDNHFRIAVQARSTVATAQGWRMVRGIEQRVFVRFHRSTITGESQPSSSRSKYTP